MDVKSRAGKRAVGIPDPLLQALRVHKEAQDKERERAAELWEEGGWVFAQPNGRPIDPRADHDDWKALLTARLGSVTRGYMTRVTQRPPCSWCSECRPGPSWNSWAGRRCP